MGKGWKTEYSCRQQWISDDLNEVYIYAIYDELCINCGSDEHRFFIEYSCSDDLATQQGYYPNSK